MSDKVNYTESSLTKTEILRALAMNLQQLSFETDGDDPVFTAEAKQTKDGVVIECTDGTTIELKIASVRR